MARYIDAERFDHFEYDGDRGIEFDSPREAYVQGVEFVLNAIHETTTADVQEVKHGKWFVYSDLVDVRCDICGQFSPMQTDFCPHCGARMDGGVCE